jgi:histidinol phosphatase-like enzyme (inositol monophosphatase family)
MPIKNASSEMHFAVSACKTAGEIAMEYWRRGVTSTNKADGTPVTQADKECERLIRQKIAEQFPDDGILGEEELEKQSSGNGRRWIIDPIDGTYNYARGIPIFATLLALECDGKIVLGVVHAPAMLETFWAETGSGAFKNGVKVKVSDRQSVDKAFFNFGAPIRIHQLGYWEGLTKLVCQTERQRCPGDYLGFAMVFEGKADAMLEVGVKPWDIAPMKILAEEAGGKFSDLNGGTSVYVGDCLITNGLVHDSFETTLRRKA